MTGRLTTIAIALAFTLVGCASGPPVGQQAPAFSAVDAEGNEVSLASFNGEVLILDFWAVW